MNRRLFPGCLGAVAFLVTACDVVRAKYPTAAAARADQAIERGWLPAALPDSAFDIAESHDLDINTGEGSFRFDARDADSFRGQLSPLSESQLRLLGSFCPNLKRDGYTYYEALGYWEKTPHFWLAVNWQTHHVRFSLLYQF